MFNDLSEHLERKDLSIDTFELNHIRESTDFEALIF